MWPTSPCGQRGVHANDSRVVIARPGCTPGVCTAQPPTMGTGCLTLRFASTPAVRRKR